MSVGQCPSRHVWGGNVQAAVALPTALAIPWLGLLTLVVRNYRSALP